MTSNPPEPIRKSLLPCTPPAEWEFHTVLGARSDTEGVALFPGDAGPVVIRRQVTYGGWEPVRPERWAQEPEAAAPAVSSVVGQATRDRIASAVRRQAETGNVRYEAIADAVLAVLPPPADRAAAFASVRPHTLASIACHLDARAVAILRPESETYAEWQTVAAELRRLADEAQQPGIPRCPACGHNICDANGPCGALLDSWQRCACTGPGAGEAQQQPDTETQCPTPESHNWGCGCPGDQLPLHAESGVDTPGCDCGHDGMGPKWHEKACAWLDTLTVPQPPAASAGVQTDEEATP